MTEENRGVQDRKFYVSLLLAPPSSASLSHAYFPELLASLSPSYAPFIQLLLSQAGAKFFAVTDWILSILEPRAAPMSSDHCHLPILLWIGPSVLLYVPAPRVQVTMQLLEASREMSPDASTSSSSSRDILVFPH